MRLVVVSSSISRDGGGVSESARLQVHALRKTGEIDIEVVTVIDTNYLADLRLWSNVKVVGFKYYGPDRFRFSPGLFFYLVSQRADLIHVHGLWTFHCFAVFISHLIHRTSYVVTPHGMLESWITARSRWLKKVISTLYQTAFLNRASAIQILTEKEREDLAHLENKRLWLIPNYVDQLEDTGALPSWWIDCYQSARIFLFIGRIHKKKGWDELCDAWASACRASDAFRAKSLLVFCGWGEDANDLSPRVKALDNLYGNVKFCGPVFGTDKWATIRASNFLVLPSKSEGLPMSVLEAWSAGKIALISKECNLPEGLESRIALDIGTSVESIVRGLLNAIDLTDLELNLAAGRCHDVLEEQFSEKLVRSELLKMYHGILG
jgi:glycosyltransferase involved in cell wall biosynthesis